MKSTLALAVFALALAHSAVAHARPRNVFHLSYPGNAVPQGYGKISEGFSPVYTVYCNVDGSVAGTITADGFTEENADYILYKSPRYETLLDTMRAATKFFNKECRPTPTQTAVWQGAFLA